MITTYFTGGMKNSNNNSKWPDQRYKTAKMMDKVMDKVTPQTVDMSEMSFQNDFLMDFISSIKW